MNATNYAENAIGSALFLGVALPAVMEWSVALFTAAPSEAGIGGAEVSSSGTGYARQRLDAGANWAKRPDQDAEGRTVFYNVMAVQFPSALSPWGTVTHFGLVGPSGHAWIIAPLTAIKAVNSGDAPVFLAGELEISIA